MALVGVVLETLVSEPEVNASYFSDLVSAVKYIDIRAMNIP